MKHVNRIVSALFMAMAGLIYWSASNFGQTLIRDNYLGAAFYPKILAGGMAIMAIVLLFSKARLVDEAGNRRERIGDVYGREVVQPLSAVLFLVVFGVLLPFFGFILSTTVLFGALLALFGAKKIWYYVFGPLFVVVLYLLFDRIFLVQLPAPFWS